MNSSSGMGVKNSSNFDPIEHYGNNETWIDGILSISLHDYDEDV